MVRKTGGIEDGGRVVLRVRRGPAKFRWELVHSDYEEGRRFCDEQVRGPLAKWRHEHRFTATDNGGCLVEDIVDWAPPLGPAGQLFAGPVVDRELGRLFAFRYRRLRDDLDRARRYGGREPLTVAVTGASGLVGSALVHMLDAAGHKVLQLVRRPTGPHDNLVQWDPKTGEIDGRKLEGIDALVHLAGESITGERWSDDKKKRILESRVKGTELLSLTISRLASKPKVMVSASAVGYYGDRGNELLTEGSKPGKGFLSGVCRQWEAATRHAERSGVRVVHLRTGMVLNPRGGALGTMLLPFKVGIGGRLGSGKQYVSWIDADDLLGLINHAICEDSVSGPLNASAPYPVPNATFADVLGRVLHRPTVIPVPGLAIRALFGEMGRELLLQGQRVLPKKAEATGYEFLFPGLEDSLRFELGRPDTPPPRVD
ncbi:MAG: TIGR01777 family oxidoreductase [Gemmatimonadota bacterium]|nr:MAG: TIGR01777 family oxidoreductase [Gemmatimonadota bacterium]